MNTFLQALQHTLPRAQVTAHAPAMYRIVQPGEKASQGCVVTVTPQETRQHHDRVAIAVRSHASQSSAAYIEGDDFSESAVGLGQGQQGTGRRHIGLYRSDPHIGLRKLLQGCRRHAMPLALID
jgi:hypothetical protein